MLCSNIRSIKTPCRFFLVPRKLTSQAQTNQGTVGSKKNYLLSVLLYLKILQLSLSRSEIPHSITLWAKTFCNWIVWNVYLKEKMDGNVWKLCAKNRGREMYETNKLPNFSKYFFGFKNGTWFKHFYLVFWGFFLFCLIVPFGGEISKPSPLLHLCM